MDFRNRCLLSLAYKLIDRFQELTLFGGIVRDVICPAMFNGEDPFDSSYESKERIEDLDIYFTWKHPDPGAEEENPVLDEERASELTTWFFTNLMDNGKIREWDWVLQKYERLKLYSISAVRFFIRHQITGVETHIDLVGTENPKNIFLKDMDVNMFVFNKADGLFLKKKMTKKIQNFFKQKKIQDEILVQIMKKQCNTIFRTIPLKNVRYESDEKILKLQIKRFMKMIRKGWTILNMPEELVVNEKTETDCAICYKLPVDRYLYITPSKCTLCLDCFETLLETDLSTRNRFRCPLSRTEYFPWSIGQW